MKIIFKSIFVRSISSISTLTFTFLGTKLYGLSDVGEFAFFLSLVTFFSMLNGFGMSIPFFLKMKESAPQHKIYLYKELSRIQNKLSILLSILIILPLLYLGVDNAILITLSSFIIPKILINTHVIRSFGHVSKFVFFQLGNIHFFSLPVMFLANFYNINHHLIDLYFIGTLIHFILSQIYVLRDFSNISLIKKTKALLDYKRIIKESSEYLTIDLINYIFNWVPVFGIMFFSSSETLGIYYNIIKVGSVFVILLFLIESISMDSLKRLAERIDQRHLIKVKELKRNVLLMSTICYLILIFFGEIILYKINPILGQYNFSLLIYSFSQIFILSFGPVAMFMKISENQQTMIKILSITSAMNTILCFLMIPYLNLIGVFLSIFLSNIFWCFRFKSFIKKNYKFSL